MTSGLSVKWSAWRTSSKRVEEGNEEPGWLETATFRSRQLRDSAGSLGYELWPLSPARSASSSNSIEAGSECNMESIVCHIDALMLARQRPYRRMGPSRCRN